MAKKRKAGGKGGLPSKSEILEYIRESESRVGKREIARAFGIKGDDRIELKRRLQEMADEGLIDRGRRQEVRPAGTLPHVAVVEITGLDVDGEMMARPVKWDREEAPPPVYMAPSESPSGRVPALGIGDRVLARLRPVDGQYEARTIKRLDTAPQEILGVFQVREGQGRIVPTDRKAKQEYMVAKADAGGAKHGDLVLAQVQPGKKYMGLKPARVTDNLGSMDHPKSISLIAIHTHGLPVDFPRKALEEAEAAQPVDLGQRRDIRDIPLVTIDPEDARDHDDAVWAAPDTDPNNPGGWEVIVAIADVAHYVTPRSALDNAARERGNSTYFPDRVVPMLPESLSNDLCSLKPGEDRACLAVRMVFDADGNKRRHKFFRGLMRSRAALSYSQAQRAQDGHPDPEFDHVTDEVIAPLYGAFAALMQERARRNPLDLDVPEREIDLTEDGTVLGISLRERFDAHRLIEEFMIRANVAAAETLERGHLPCMYRVHEEPALDKLESLRGFLDSLGYNLPRAQVLKPEHFNRILSWAEDTPHDHVVNEVVLRSQSQAYYSPENKGHFGLALDRYAHFTSPIRRYADLLVHRALLRHLNWGDGALTDEAAQDFGTIGEDISRLERRAMTAEREASDRYLAAFLADRVGADFAGRISGVTRFGLFVTLTETGADGLIPMASLAHDYFIHEPEQHALIGKHTGETYRLGDSVAVRLKEAEAITGGIRLELLERAGGKPKGGEVRPGAKRRSKAKKTAPGKAKAKAGGKGKSTAKDKAKTPAKGKKKRGR